MDLASLQEELECRVSRPQYRMLPIWRQRAPPFKRMLFNSIRLNRIETERFRSIEECRFLAYVFLNRHESRSQILQDLWVSYELGEKREGFFVEFGASNGVVNSNTWLLEKKYGWKAFWLSPIRCGIRCLQRIATLRSIIVASIRVLEK
jgi:hypothetical protein